MLFVGEQILKLAPKPSAEALASFPKPKKAVVCLKGKIRALDKLHPGVSHSAVGRELNVNESTTWYIQEKQEEICKSVLEATPVKAEIKSTYSTRGNDGKVAKPVDSVWHRRPRGHDQLQKRSGQHCVRLKAKEMYGHITQGQKSV